MTFDIPITISVTSTNEDRAEQAVLDFLVQAIKEYGVEYGIKDFQYFEFVTQESCNTGCGNNNCC